MPSLNWFAATKVLYPPAPPAPPQVCTHTHTHTHQCLLEIRLFYESQLWEDIGTVACGLLIPFHVHISAAAPVLSSLSAIL